MVISTPTLRRASPEQTLGLHPVTSCFVIRLDKRPFSALGTAATARRVTPRLAGHSAKARAMITPVDTARRRATYDDLLKVSDTMVAEILDGELYATPRPASPHARAASMLGGDLSGPFDRPPGGPGGPGGWWLLDEPELHLGPDVVVPDIAGWRREKMPVLPNVAAFTQAPDWACEVVSPTTAGADRVRKMRIYARENLGHLWLVDPISKTLEVYRLEAPRWVVLSTHSGSDRVRVEPFEAVELEIARWWLEP